MYWRTEQHLGNKEETLFPARKAGEFWIPVEREKSIIESILQDRGSIWFVEKEKREDTHAFGLNTILKCPLFFGSYTVLLTRFCS